MTQFCTHRSGTQAILASAFFYIKFCLFVQVSGRSWEYFIHLKVHFVIHSLIPPVFTKKVEMFTSAEAFTSIMFVCKIFLAKSFLWRNDRSNCLFIMSTYLITNIVVYATVDLWYSKTCITHKRNLRNNWKFGYKLILSILIMS